MHQKFLALAVYALLSMLCSSVEAQQSKAVPCVGILFVGGKEQPHLLAFKNGLRELGYSEGKNIIFEYRYAEG
jgi:hypothetical protein